MTENERPTNKGTEDFSTVHYFYIFAIIAVIGIGMPLVILLTR